MPRVAYCVTIEVDPEVEEAWNRWHAEVHVREVLAEPGFLGATRYRDASPCFDGWARHVCRYDLESWSALDAYPREARSAELRADHQARWGATTRVSRQVLVELDVIATKY